MIRKYLLCINLILLIFGNINAKSFVDTYRGLRIESAQPVDNAGKPVILGGVSFGSSDFCTEFYNKNVVKWLHKDWNVNFIRVSISDISQIDYSIKLIKKVVDAAIKERIYVIVSFNNPDIQLDAAVKFFNAISSKYAKYPNIIYEIFNVPDNEPLKNMKTYSEDIVAIIRTKNAEAPVIRTGNANVIINEGLSLFYENEICSMLLPAASSKGKWKKSDLTELGITTREYLRKLNDPKQKTQTVTSTLFVKPDMNLITMGRTETLSNGNIILISAASVVELCFSKKEEFDIELRSLNGKYAYVSVEVDGNYAGRKRIDASTMLSFVFTDTALHTVKIFKATEATSGDIEVVIPENLQTVRSDATNYGNKKIEFIGNSIISGMGNDLEIACDKNEEWYDQHNAYFSYATQLALTLGFDFQLSSVSGIGMYRNWNDEHISEPIMPDIYQNLYLNTDKSKPYKFEFHPDIIFICLGTNDLSDGDGIKPRLPFNSEKFVNNYIDFIKMLYSYNPEAQIILLDSPMLTDKKRALLNKCLDNIKAVLSADKAHKEIKIFHFSDKIIPNGCGYHPDIENNMQMKDEMLDLLKKLL